MKLGINGFGRIGKLTMWHHVGRKFFDEIVINIGRKVGTSFDDLLHYLERDSTYGFIQNYLYGYGAESVINSVDIINNKIIIDGISVKFLMESRNPADIDWKSNLVEIVVDTTGQFLDPFLPYDYSKGALRGHFIAGAKKIILSAPFKFGNKKLDREFDNIVTTVMGVNDKDYNSNNHSIISNASCTTTCLAHMIKPLIDVFGAKRILSASMATVHATTGSQEVLDRLPKSNKRDLRKNRSILNNIILTTTGAAEALGFVMPEIKNIGFMAQSVRVPVMTGSLVILVLSIQENINKEPIDRNTINSIYKKKAKVDSRGYLRYTDKQNVSIDISRMYGAATIIEGHETHTRTGEISLDLSNIPGINEGEVKIRENANIYLPITQAVIYGWYDNEMSGYVTLLGDRTVSIAEDF